MKYFLPVFAAVLFLSACHKEKRNPDDIIKKIAYKFYAADSSFTFYIPTGFTPNGDNINDYWEPESNSNVLDSSQYMINIFNKGGELLFSTATPAKYYGQGKNGKILSEQTLCFFIEVRDKLRGDKHTFKGQFILFR
ncbi:MAG: T9SS type B sorting domain-containing protein [Bacteroidetes bacterium]|nr:MAG: T9SS type B sorting domain-containing protein [Bacteroidota bacterium]